MNNFYYVNKLFTSLFVFIHIYINKFEGVLFTKYVYYFLYKRKFSIHNSKVLIQIKD